MERAKAVLGPEVMAAKARIAATIVVRTAPGTMVRRGWLVSGRLVSGRLVSGRLVMGSSCFALKAIAKPDDVPIVIPRSFVHPRR
jgi:hypothetical protein